MFKIFLVLIFCLNSALWAGMHSSCLKIFGSIEKDRKSQDPWIAGRDMQVTAKDFEKLFKKFSNDSEFRSCLWKFLGRDLDKYYYIAMFLFLEDYTKLNESFLADEIFDRGIRLVTVNCSIAFESGSDSYSKCMSLVPMHGMRGYLHWKLGNKAKSKYHIERAWSMSKIYSGSFPAMEQEVIEAMQKEFELK